MQKLIFLSLMLIILTQQSLLACAGCLDAGVSDKLAVQQAEINFELAESKVAMQIEAMTNLLKNEILKTQKNNAKEEKILKALQQESLLDEKDMIFQFTQNKELQGNLNSTSSLKD